ncbi:MAG TPA: metalloregulator ArsR/SmtB family transcription factor [Candidatus Binatia bacterium]|nr:metalloregulator ArsR/SmtB family transcription factor [Candidatus Binatia bacterium]
MALYPPPEARTLDRVFQALADPTRRAIVSRLAEGEASVTEIARPFPLSLPAVTKHLQVLERAGLLQHEKRGRVRHCHLVGSRMEPAATWLERYRGFWDTRLTSLSDYFRSQKETS